MTNDPPTKSDTPVQPWADKFKAALDRAEHGVVTPNSIRAPDCVVEHPYYPTWLDRVRWAGFWGRAAARELQKRKAAEAQRDELLAALKDVVALGTDPVIRIMCENAIAKAEGK